MTIRIPDCLWQFLPRPRWWPSPFFALSLVLPVALIVLGLSRPSAWLLMIVVFVVDQLILAAAGLWPRSTLLGRNMRRLPEAAARRNEVAITFDDGPDPQVTPQVLDCLERFGAHASFFCPAQRAQAHPELVAEILRRGHSIENHSWRHPMLFSLYGWRRTHRELETSQRILGELTKRRPMFFRAPAGLRNPLLDPLLARFGLRLVSWTRRGFDATHGNAAAVLARLVRNLAAGDILLLHDGHAARDVSGQSVVLTVLPQLLERCAAADLVPVSLQMACSVMVHVSD